MTLILGSGEPVDDIYALLREDSLQLASKFRKASIEGRGTPQEIADFREHALQDFLSRFFPFPQRITKGKVRDSFGAISASVDCVVCSSNHPHTIDSHGKFTLLFAEGVDAAIEVKPDISNKVELERGLEQGLTVKALRRAITPGVRQGHWGYERQRRVPFLIFAMKCKSEPRVTGMEIMDFYAKRNVDPVDQADFVAVNGVGIFVNVVHEQMSPWTFAQEGTKTGWFFEQIADDTLANFLLYLHHVAHAGLKLQEDVLPRYLRGNGTLRSVVIDLSKNWVRPTLPE